MDVIIGRTTAPLRLVHDGGVFEAIVDGQVPDYRLEVSYGQESHTVDDPYRWLPTLGEIDLHLIGEGRHENLWEVLGAHVRSYETPGGPVTGTSFAVWAPNARGVRVVGDFDYWSGRALPMRVAGLVRRLGAVRPRTSATAAGTSSRSSARTASVARQGRPDGVRHRDAAGHRVGRAHARATTWTDDEWLERRATHAVARGADVDLRGAPRLVAAWPVLPRAGRRACRLRPRDRVHPRRVPAGCRAPVRRLVGLPGLVLLRAVRALRHPGRLPAPCRRAAPAPASA